MTIAIGPVIDALRLKMKFVELRAGPPSQDYLEAVLNRGDLPMCCELLVGVFGPPLKVFGEAAMLESSIESVVASVGGIRTEQCLFLQSIEGARAAYAALWPWASDPMRVTLKVGIAKLA